VCVSEKKNIFRPFIQNVFFWLAPNSPFLCHVKRMRTSRAGFLMDDPSLALAKLNPKRNETKCKMIK
jgi:hypothetical protein